MVKLNPHSSIRRTYYKPKCWKLAIWGKIAFLCLGTIGTFGEAQLTKIANALSMVAIGRVVSLHKKDYIRQGFHTDIMAGAYG